MIEQCARDHFEKMESEDQDNRNVARASITKLEVQDKKGCC